MVVKGLESFNSTLTRRQEYDRLRRAHTDTQANIKHLPCCANGVCLAHQSVAPVTPHSLAIASVAEHEKASSPVVARPSTAPARQSSSTPLAKASAPAKTSSLAKAAAPPPITYAEYKEKQKASQTISSEVEQQAKALRDFAESDAKKSKEITALKAKIAQLESNLRDKDSNIAALQKALTETRAIVSEYKRLESSARSVASFRSVK